MSCFVGVYHFTSTGKVHGTSSTKVSEEYEIDPDFYHGSVAHTKSRETGRSMFFLLSWFFANSDTVIDRYMNTNQVSKTVAA